VDAHGSALLHERLIYRCTKAGLPAAMFEFTAATGRVPLVRSRPWRRNTQGFSAQKQPSAAASICSPSTSHRRRPRPVLLRAPA